jgi:hypothetical protein
MNITKKIIITILALSIFFLAFWGSLNLLNRPEINNDSIQPIRSELGTVVPVSIRSLAPFSVTAPRSGYEILYPEGKQSTVVFYLTKPLSEICQYYKGSLKDNNWIFLNFREDSENCFLYGMKGESSVNVTITQVLEGLRVSMSIFKQQ